MRIFIATDVTIFRNGEKIFAQEKYATIFKRYHNGFGKIVLCARSKEISSLTKGLVDVTDIVETVVIIDSLLKMLLGKYNRRIEQEIQNCKLVVVRCPGFAAFRAAKCSRKLRKPYLVESMGCAWDAYWNHGLVGKAIAPYMFFMMKKTVYCADYAVYVTRQFLQKRYPSKNQSIGVSNVLIDNIDQAVLQRRLDKIANLDKKKITLATTAAVDVRYKGQEYVINAIPALNKAGIRVHYLLIGGGDQTYLRKIAEKNGVTDQVEFVGNRPLAEVFNLLDTADIYVQPSLQEGLPRAVIESMSRGCPVIGAKTAGIPELIAQECVVRRKSAKDIADTIQKILNDEKLEQLARENHTRASEYLDEVLSTRRSGYYERIKQQISE